MPGGNRTGPNGMGPMTGRGAGYCTGNNMPGYVNFGARGASFGRGGGGGRGGRGNRNMFYATGMPGWMRYGDPGYYPATAPAQGYYPANAPVQEYSKDDEVRFLSDQAEYLKKELDNINNRLSNLEKEE